jgi:hypothetical protein
VKDSLGIGAAGMYKISSECRCVCVAETGCKIEELTVEHQKDLWF